MKNLKKFNIKFKKTTRPIYSKRYKDNGEEYLKKIDEINIEEDLKEKSLEINRIKEIYNIKERLKTEELIDDLTNEEYLEQLKELQNYNELDTYEFLNKTEELKELYNKMPEEIRIKYKNLSKFGKEYLPQLIKQQKEKIEKIEKIKNTENKEQKITETTKEIEKQIENKEQ